MANGPLSSVMLIASAGLLDNQGLDVAANLSVALDSYTTLPVISELLEVIQDAEDAGNLVISDSRLQSLRNLGASEFPALTDSLPAAQGNTPAGQFSGAVLARANTIMGNGDLTKFAQIYSMCRGYQATANQFIAASNGTTLAAATFVDMDAITTGGFSLVNSDPRAFGADLEALGVAINPADINLLGFPSALLRQVLNEGGLLPGLRAILEDNGVTTAEISDIADSTVALAGTVETRIYAAMQDVQGDDLAQVLQILEVVTPNISQMSDLLNPIKIFPNSFLGLLLLVGLDKTNIYLPDGIINTDLEQEFVGDEAFDLLKVIIPAESALANRCLSRSFYQIKNLTSLTLPDLARAALAVETNAGLGDINSLDTPVPAADAEAVKTGLAPGNTATGAGGSFTLYDFVGTAAGYPYIDEFGNLVPALGNIADQNGFASLLNTSNGAYPVMLDTLDGVYGDPSAGPITGMPAPFNSGDPYPNADVAFGTYITVTQSLIGTIAGTYPEQTATSDAAWTVMTDQYQRETENWQLAMLEIDELLANNKPALMGIVTSLHEIGVDDAPFGPAEFFQAIANTETSAGQAVVASLREGKNIKNLQDAGVGIDTQLP